MKRISLPILSLFVLSAGATLLLAAPQALAAEEAIHERIEWSDVWVVNADSDERPRVLLVGDSIVRGYYAGVEAALGESVNCARFTTSKFLGHPDFQEELGLLLRRFSFDVIHVNNGLHGWGYTEEQYREALAALIAFLKKESPGSKVVWCMTTPVRDSADLSTPDADKQPRVEARNAIAAAIMAEQGVAVNDLHALSAGNDRHFSKDGVHFSEEGRAAQSQEVAEAIRPLLPAPKGTP